MYDVVASIPEGKVATYGQVAELAASPKAARAVGVCMRNNTSTSQVPCHRVVGAKGKLVGYAFGNGTETKRELLQNEGVTFRGDVVDLRKSGWKANPD